MIYSRLIPTFVLLFSFVSLTAQQIKWGPEAKADRASGKLYSLGWHDGFLYSAEKDGMEGFKIGGDVVLEKLSKDMKLVFSKKFEIGRVSALSPSVYQIYNKKLQVFSHGISNVYKYSFDLDGNSLGNEKIAETKEVFYDPVTRYGPGTAFGSSPEGKRIAHLIYDSMIEEESEYSIDIVSFNEDGGELKRFSKVFRIEGELRYLKVDEFFLDDKFNMVIYYSYKEKKADYVYEKMLVVSKEGEVVRDMRLSHNGLLLRNIEFKLSEDNKLYFTGMFGRFVEKRVRMGGFFIGSINTDTYEIEDIREYSYTEEFFASLGYKIKKDGNVKFSGSYSLELILDEKGGGFFIANHKQRYKSTGVSDKEMLVIHFDENLKMGKVNVIPRHLNSYAPILNGLGYFPFIHNGILNLVYTDHRDNLGITNLEDAKEADDPKDKKAVVFQVKIGKDDFFNKQLISEKNDIGGYLIPDKCQAVDGKYVINLGNKKKVLYGELIIR